MIEMDDFKNKIVYHLKTFSSEKKPLSSRYFYEQLGIDDAITMRDFQRMLADTIAEIIADQYIHKDYVVCSCNEGYFIPKTEEGFLKGRNYLITKIDEVQQRIRFIDTMRIKKVYKRSDTSADIFSNSEI